MGLTDSVIKLVGSVVNDLFDDRMQACLLVLGYKLI